MDLLILLGQNHCQPIFFVQHVLQPVSSGSSIVSGEYIRTTIRGKNAKAPTFLSSKTEEDHYPVRSVWNRLKFPGGIFAQQEALIRVFNFI